MNEISPWPSNFQDFTFESKEIVKNGEQMSSAMEIYKQPPPTQKMLTPSNKKTLQHKTVYKRPLSSPSKRFVKHSTKYDLEQQILKLQSQQIPLDIRSSQRLSRRQKTPVHQKEFTIGEKLRGNGAFKMFSPYKSLHKSTSRLSSGKKQKQHKNIIENKIEIREEVNLKKEMEEMMLRLGKKREELKIVKKSVNKERPKKEEPQKEKRKLGYVYFNRHFM